MTYSARQREQIRARLQARLAQLRQQVDTDVSRNVQGQDLALQGGEPGDEGDRAVNASTMDLALGEAHRHADAAAQMLAALRRLDEDGDEEAAFGQCVQCGADIPVERMLAQPTAVRCFACQSQHEKTHQALEVHTL